MENLSNYGLSLVLIDDDFHLYDLISNEVYEVMSLSYIEELVDKWNKMGQYLFSYGIIKITI